ncbi:primase-helicase family protein [Methylomagnum ishizawai]|uniref:primase-helicase family protein n=1 Tax=Methylomagnum ishizawai TaxID=1760988 RepID=UPI001C7F58FA|nr:primase-helicase family protein [Methylomagnum ishizawai]
MLPPVEGKDLAKFNNLLKGIRDSGFSDPGSKTSIHYFRLPGGVNGGPNGKGHVVTAELWNPQARYTLEELAEAFDAYLSGTKKEAPKIPEKDAYLEALSDLGVVTGNGLNDHGWIDILCPWWEEHSDRAKTGAAYGVGMRFRCHHGHCEHRHFHDLRLWMAGKKVDVAALDLKMESRENYLKVLAYRMVYDQTSHKYYDLKHRVWVGIEPLNATHLDVVKHPVHTILLKSPELNKVINTTYLPMGLPWNRRVEGGEALPTSARMLMDSGVMPPRDTTFIPDPVNEDATKVLNLWTPGKIKPAKDFRPDIADRWLAHLRWMYPDPEDAQAVLDFLTCVVAFRGTKINFALLMVAEVQGVGRDTLLTPILNILGRGNYQQPNAQVLANRFNGYLQSELIVCSELDAGDGDKVKIYNQLKEVITIPPDYYGLEEKGLPVVKVKKTANLIINSNDSRALILDANDRRVDVRKCPRTKAETLEYEATGAYSALHDEYDGKIRVNGIAVDNPKESKQQYHEQLYAWFLQNPISPTFNPKGRAPTSRAKEEMIDRSASRVDREVREALDAGDGPFQYALVELKEVEHYLQDQGIRFVGNQVLYAMERAGCKKYPKKVKTDKTANKSRWFWITRDTDAWLKRPGVDLKNQYNREREEYADPLFD